MPFAAMHESKDGPSETSTAHRNKVCFRARNGRSAGAARTRAIDRFRCKSSHRDRREDCALQHRPRRTGRSLSRPGSSVCASSEPSMRLHGRTTLAQDRNRKNMLETAVFWAPRPIKPGRHPLQRVITRPRPGTDLGRSRHCDAAMPDAARNEK